MRKILVGLLSALLLLIAIVLIVPFFIDLNNYKPEIQDQVRKTTGRELVIGGDIKLALIPTARVELSDVTFSNAPSSSTSEPMASIGALSVELQVLPLITSLGKDLVIDRFVLDRPDILLEVSADGKGNWVFDAPAGTENPDAAQPAADQSADASSSSSSSGDVPLTGLSLGDVRLIEGRVRYIDQKGGVSEEISAINLDVELRALDAPMQLNGTLDWKQQTIALEAEITTPKTLLGQEATVAKLDVTSAPVSFGYNGTVQSAAVLKMQGDLELAIPSLKGLLDWVEVPLERQREDIFENVSLTGSVSLNDKMIAANGLKLVFDALQASGDVAADLSGSVPKLTADLKTGILDVTPYLPAEEQEQSGAESSASSPETAQNTASKPVSAEQGWSDEPIDLSALRQLNANLKLKSDGIKVRKITIGEADLAIELQDGKLKADLNQLALYDGAAQGRVALDASSSVAKAAVDFGLVGVQAQPLLSDAADFDRLSGTASANISIVTTGNSQKAMVSALNGDGDVQFRDGALTGINIAELIRNISLDALNNAFSDSKTTDFAELSGSFKVTSGVVENSDLLMVAPLFRLTGQGQVPLPPRTVDYTVTPRAVADLEGQGGDADAKGVGIPVLIKGSWSDPQIAPDLEGLVKDQLSNPENLIKELTGDDDKANEIIEKLPVEPDAIGGALNKLFGN
ncbi:AsmA family protein [Kiloniella sp. b19]|uniref:AsmA family protein n=1 Tax=Kiloniella sp. GXU_MW_B19 TaxID=3141326 RepID=UPI0031E0C53B